MKKKYCESCDNMVDELFIVDISYPFMSSTEIICEDCISELYHENIDYVVLGKKE